MIRRAHILWLLAVAALSAGQFRVSDEARQLEDELQAYNRAILAEQESVRVLKAEWAYLNDPARIQRLAERFLSAAPVEATQVVALGDLPPRLDAPIGSAPAVAEAPKRRAPVREDPIGALLANMTAEDQ